MPESSFASEYVLTYISSFPQNIELFHERLLHILHHVPHSVGPVAQSV
jgi:hypothetical protein